MIEQAAKELLDKRPKIGTPAWSKWHKECVATALRLSQKHPDMSFIKFWKLCGMPS